MAGPTDREQIACIARPAQLPCGRVLPNRLVKAAMEEMLPADLQEALYEVWAEGGWGMLISGNVQVSPAHLGTPFDLAVPPLPFPPSSLDAFARWARSTRPTSGRPAPLAVLQLNHPGRQSMRLLCGRPFSSPALAPSAVPLRVAGPLGALLWGTPRAMDAADLDAVVRQFVDGARLARDAGWDGVQIHASHGYLVASFMSPQVNRRTDVYGGTARKRLTLLLRIVAAIRAECPQASGFCLGVKLNCSDFVKGGLTEQDALDNVKWIAEHGGVDFIEISGGSYESPEFMNRESSPNAPKRPSTLQREAFFDTFSHRARFLLSTLPPSTLATPAPLILLTGGFRTRHGIARALSPSSHSPPTADLAGLARPAAADPFLPLALLSHSVPSSAARAPPYDPLAGVHWLRALCGGIAIAGPGLDVLYHTMALRVIALRRAQARSCGSATSEVRRTGRGEDPRAGWWGMAWRAWVKPALPGWTLGVAGAVILAVVGSRWAP
ncbi:hypothetical protein JCM3770_005055 [Rhodotorula araucariae]